MTHERADNKVEALLKIMADLRAPKGCPWDAEQTPESLAPFILEEACELIDAIESGNTDLILDELGDLLLQVVFQAQIFKERKEFDFHDVTAGIAEKLIRRHPHVFACNGSATQTAELDKQWDAIKRSESTHNKTCLADHLPNKLPSLQRAQKLVIKAYRSDRQAELPSGHQPLQQELERSGILAGSPSLNEQALGQVLFSLVRLANDAGIDAETALRKTTRQVIEQFDKD